MIPPVYPTLMAAPAVTALVGDRILRKVAPQNTPRPYIVWRVVFGLPANYVGEAPGIDNFRAQVDCIADTDVQCRALAEAVQAALQPHAVELGVNIDEQDEETGLHRYSVDWSFWTPRT